MRLPTFVKKKPRIEIIPMIDTMFFLLVFFMIATLSMTIQHGMPVSLPTAESSTDTIAEHVSLTLTREGLLYYNKEAITLQELAIRLANLRQSSSDPSLLINSDEQVLTYLGLKTGQPLDDMLVYTLQAKLLNTGHFRFVDVEARINTDEPQQSTLTLVLEETALATPLGQELTEKEVLMQKVGQFFDDYQSWEKDVLIQADSQKNAEFADWLQQHQGISAPVIEWIYSSTKGIVLSEIINQNHTLNVIVISPEQIRYVCPPINQNII